MIFRNTILMVRVFKKKYILRKNTLFIQHYENGWLGKGTYLVDWPDDKGIWAQIKVKQIQIFPTVQSFWVFLVSPNSSPFSRRTRASLSKRPLVLLVPKLKQVQTPPQPLVCPIPDHSSGYVVWCSGGKFHRIVYFKRRTKKKIFKYCKLFHKKKKKSRKKTESLTKTSLAGCC